MRPRAGIGAAHGARNRQAAGSSRWSAATRSPPSSILAYALSWWAWVWYRLDPENVGAPILPMGPLLAALIVLPLIGGWPALRDLLRRIVLLARRLGLVSRRARPARSRSPSPRSASTSSSGPSRVAGFQTAGARRSRRALRLHLPLDRPRRGAGLARLRAAAAARRPQRARRGADPRDRSTSSGTCRSSASSTTPRTSCPGRSPSSASRS